MNPAKPNLIPLIILSFLDGILALASILPISWLAEAHFTAKKEADLFLYLCLFLFVIGDFLAIGYVVTLITKRFSRLFWLLSFFVNVPLCLLYLFVVISGGAQALPLLIWCGFVTGTSYYYGLIALEQNKLKLR